MAEPILRIRDLDVRFPLDVIETVRAAWPDSLPLSVRISSVDGVEGGIELADSVVFAREAKARGADIIDCSSGGNVAVATIPVAPGFQTPFAAQIRRDRSRWLRSDRAAPYPRLQVPCPVFPIRRSDSGCDRCISKSA